jgi:D-xylose transport system permease protein
MSTSAPAPAPEQDVTASAVVQQDERPSLRLAVRKLAQGELGPVRVLLVLAVIWVIFAIANSSFLTAINLTNLALQFTGLGMISVGVVLVLLLGEIDLSVGAVSGVCASIVAVLNVKNGWNPYLAMIAGLAAGAAIGLLQGSIATRFDIPSFVVTLAGLLIWQGVQLKVLGDTGTVNINDTAITNLAGSFLADWLGWVVAIGASAAIAALTLAHRRRRAAAGLELQPVVTMVISIVAPIVAILVAVYVVNQDRGVPVSLLILVGTVVLFAFITTRLPYGRHIYAVGGNAEAARRAGIAVPWIRTSVFVLASTLAAAGGILLAARLLAVNQSSGGSDLLLNAIAGPVIAGVSLFGGRGSVWAALLGALVIQSISNGMDLLGLESPVKFIVTGGVLIGAVMLDAISRGRRRAVGRV